MVGMYKCMGDEVYQYKVVTLDVVHKLVDELESDYKSSKDWEEQWHLVDQAVFILVVFLTALRGEDLFKLVLGVVRDYFKKATGNEKIPRIVLPMKGIFKGETGENFYCLVVTACSRSGLRIGPWVKRWI